MYKPSWYIRSINSLTLTKTNTGRPHHATHHAMEKSKLPLDPSHYCIAFSLQSARTWTERETVGLHWAPPSRSTKLRSRRGVRNQYTYLCMLQIDTSHSVYTRIYSAIITGFLQLGVIGVFDPKTGCQRIDPLNRCRWTSRPNCINFPCFCFDLVLVPSLPSLPRIPSLWLQLWLDEINLGNLNQ